MSKKENLGGGDDDIVLEPDFEGGGDIVLEPDFRDGSGPVSITPYSTPVTVPPPEDAPVDEAPWRNARVTMDAETTQVAMPRGVPVLPPQEVADRDREQYLARTQKHERVFSLPDREWDGKPTNVPDEKWQKVVRDYTKAGGNVEDRGYLGSALAKRALLHQANSIADRIRQFNYRIADEQAREQANFDRITELDAQLLPLAEALKGGKRLPPEEINIYLGLAQEREALAKRYDERMAPFAAEDKELKAAREYVSKQLQENAIIAAQDPKRKQRDIIQREADRDFAEAAALLDKYKAAALLHPQVVAEYVQKPAYKELLRFGGNVGAFALRLGAADLRSKSGDQRTGASEMLTQAADWFSDGLRNLEASKPQVTKTPLLGEDWSLNEGWLPKFVQGGTYMGLLAAGGHTGGVAGMTGMSMVGSGEDYYIMGKDSGMRDQEAEAFSLLMSGTEAFVENVNRGPFIASAARKELARRAAKAIMAGKPMRSALQEIPKYLLEQSGGEGFEEIVTSIGQHGIQLGADALTGSELNPELNATGLASDFLMGAALGGLMAVSGTAMNRPLYKESVRWAVENREAFTEWAQTNVPEEKLPEVLERLDRYSKIYRGLPPDLSPDKAANIAAAIAEKQKIKEQQKEQVLDPVVAEVAGDPLGDRLAELDEEIKQNLTPVAPDIAPLEQDRQKALSELKPDGLTHRDRKRIIAQASLEDVPLREAHKRAGYKEVGGIMVSPDVDASLLGAVHPDVWQDMVDRGISYIENSGTKGHGGALSRMHGGELSFGLDLSTELSEYVHEKEKDFPGITATRVNHVIAHEIGHKVWQNDLTDEQRAVAEKAAKGSLYARNLESGALKSAASIAEENFCENFAWGLTQRLTGQSEDSVQPDLKSLIEGLVTVTNKEDDTPRRPKPADSADKQPAVGSEGQGAVGEGGNRTADEARGDSDGGRTSDDIGTVRPVQESSKADQGKSSSVDAEAQQEEGTGAVPDDQSGVERTYKYAETPRGEELVRWDPDPETNVGVSVTEGKKDWIVRQWDVDADKMVSMKRMPKDKFTKKQALDESDRLLGKNVPEADVSTTVNTPEAKPEETTGSIDDERFLAENGVPLNKGSLTTKSGRVVDPPKLKGRQSQRLKQIDNWLVEQAIEEYKDADPLGTAKQRDNDYKLGIAKGMSGRTLSPSDRTVLNELLWEEKALTKPPAEKATKTAKVGERFKSGSAEVEVTGAWPALDGTPSVEYAFVQKDGSLGTKQRKSAAEFAALFHKHVEFRQPEAEQEKPTKQLFANLSDEKRQRALELQEKMRKLMGGQLSSGINPELMAVGVELSALVIENGARGFAAFAKEMVAQLGDQVKPYLKSLYSATRYAPGVDRAGMSSDSEVDAADVDAVVNETPLEDDTAPPTQVEPAPDALGVDDGTPARDVGGVVPDEPAGSVPDEQAPGVSGNVGADAEGGDLPSGGRNGGRRAGTRTPRRGAKQTPTAGQSEGGDTSNGGGDAVKKNRNHVLPQDEDWIPSGAKTKVRANIAAIKLLQTLESEDREATSAEKAVLAQYTGWGGLKGAVNREQNELAKAVEDDVYYVRYWSEEKRKGVDNWIKEWKPLYDEVSGLLSEEEMEKAIQSSEFAHYTSRTVFNAMWKAVLRLGFRGGAAMEPAVGIGHAIGLAPAEVRNVTDWLAIDKDSVSARITAKLYPDAQVREAGYEDVKVKPNSKALVFTNVPFSRVGVFDKRYPNMNLHNYFIVRSLDEVAPGGLAAVITSSWTMDSFTMEDRKKMAERADLVGAIRLPNNAFLKNAGTTVTADILFFRKRDDTAFDGQPFMVTEQATTHDGRSNFVVGFKGTQAEWDALDEKEQKARITEANRRKYLDPISIENFEVNQYFVEHPEMVLGNLSLAGTMHPGWQEMTVEPIPGADLEEQLDQAIERLPRDVIGKPVTDRPKKIIYAGALAREGSLTMHEGVPMVVDEAELLPVKWWDKSAKAKERLPQAKQYIALRDAMKRQLDNERNDAGTDVINASRKELNEVYDAYVEKFGRLQDFKKSRFLAETDRDFPAVAALEYAFGKGKDRTYVKMPIFSEPTVKPVDRPDEADSITDAVDISLNWTGRVDLQYIAELLKTTPERIAEDFRESGAAFENPRLGIWETPESYLSGFVKDKLEEAKQAAESDDSFKRNVEALEKVQPEPIPLERIAMEIGARWIPVDAYKKWIKEALGMDVQLVFVPEVGKFDIRWDNKDYDFKGYTNTDTYGVRYSEKFGGHLAKTGIHLIKDALNLKQPLIKYTPDEDGAKPIIDADATEVARAKLQSLNDDFKKWVKADPKRANRLEDIFNEKMNITVRPEYRVPKWSRYPGQTEMIMKEGKMVPFIMGDHQKRVTSRAMQSSTMIAHGVGFGKTFEQVTIAMELRRLGLANKPAIGVMNSTIEQIVREALVLYPNASIHFPTGDMDALERNIFMSQAAMGDWDIVIVPHSVLEMIPNDPKREQDFIREQKNELLEAKRKMAEAGGKKAPGITALNQALNSLEKRLKKLQAKEKDDVLTFEELGIDALFVDESHEFKKLPFTSSRGRGVKGLDTGANSSKGPDLWLKLKFVQEQNRGRNTFLATGTPVSNTIAEAWNIMRFLRPDVLESYGVKTFDEFDTAFVDIFTDYERTSTGNIKSVSRLTDFKNLQQFQDMWLQVADVEMDADKVSIKRPAVKGGGPATRTVKGSYALGEFTKHLSMARRKWDQMSGDKIKAEKLQNIPMRINAMAKLGALSMRYIDSKLPEEKDDKLAQIVADVKRVYDETSSFKGTQMLFSDMIESLDGKINIFEDVKKKLVKAGIPAEEILIASGLKKGKERDEAFKKLKSGAFRVAIGSTASLGTGVNAQDLLAALHHMDAPWRPMDIEQREGRILRQGNLVYSNFGRPIEINRWVVEGSYDGTIFGMLTAKARMVRQALDGSFRGDRIEDLGGRVVLGYQEAKAAATGDTRFIDKAVLEADIRRLVARRDDFDKSKRKAARDIESLEVLIPKMQANLERDKALAKEIETFIADEKAMTATIDGKQITGKPEIVKALDELFAERKKKWPKTEQEAGLLGMQRVGQSYRAPAGIIELNGKKIALSDSVAFSQTMEAGRVHYGRQENASTFVWHFTDEALHGHIGTASTGSGFFTSLRSVMGDIMDHPIKMATHIGIQEKNLGEARSVAETVYEGDEQIHEKEAKLKAIEKSLAEEPEVPDTPPTMAFPDVFTKAADLKAMMAEEEDSEDEDEDGDDDGGDDDGGGGGISESRIDDSGPMPPRQPSVNAPTRQATGRVKFNITALVQLLSEFDSTPVVNQRLRRALGRYKLSLNRVELMEKLLYDTPLAERVLSHEIGHLIDLAIEQSGKGLSFARKIKPIEAFKRKIKDSAELKKLAKALSAEWRGEFSPDDKYRNSANELFADYMSAMFNDPELVNSKYKLLHDTFQALLDGKPDFAAAYKVLTDRILGKGVAKKWIEQTMEASERSVQELTDHTRNSLGWHWARFKDAMAGLFVSPVHRLNEIQGKKLSQDLGESMIDTLEYASLFTAKENAFFEDDFRRHVAPLMERISKDSAEAFKLLDVYVQANRTIHERRAAGKWIEANHDDEARKMLLALLDQEKSLEKWVPLITNAKNSELYDLAGQIFREVHQMGEAAVARMRRRIDRMDLEITGQAALMAFNVRGKLLNPHGITVSEAKAAVDELRSMVTPEQFDAIEQAQRRLSELLFEIQFKAFNEGLISHRAYQEIIAPNKDNYAPYVVLDHFSGRVTAGIAPQAGTAKAVMNTVLATQLKAAAINSWRQHQYFTAMLILAYEKAGKTVKIEKDFAKASDIDKVRMDHRDDDVSRLVYYKDGTPYVAEFEGDPGKTFEEASVTPTRWESLETLGPLSSITAGALQLFTGWSLPFIVWGNLVRDLSTSADRIGWLATFQSLGKGGISEWNKIRLARNYAKAAFGSVMEKEVRELIAKDILQPPRTAGAMVFDNDNRRELLAAGTIMAYGLTKHQLGSKAWNKFKQYGGLNSMTRASVMYEALAKLHALDVARAAGQTPKVAAALARRAGVPKPAISGSVKWVNAMMEMLRPWTRVSIQGNRAAYNVLMNPSTGKKFAARFAAAQLGWKVTAASIKWGVPLMFYYWLINAGDDEEEEAKRKGRLAVMGEAFKRVSPYKMAIGNIIPMMFYDPRKGEYHHFWEFWEQDASTIPAHYEVVSLRVPASEEGKTFGPLFYNMMVSQDEELRMPGMDVGDAFRSWVHNQTLPGANPFIEIGGNTFSMVTGENPDDEFTGYPAANPLLYDAGWGDGRGEAITGYILNKSGWLPQVVGTMAANFGMLDERAMNIFTRRLAEDKVPLAERIPGAGAMLSYDNYSATRERGEKREEHESVEAQARMMIPPEYKEMLDFYHKNNGRKKEMDAYELVRLTAAHGFERTWGDVLNPPSKFGGGGDTLNVPRARGLASGEIRIDAPTLHARAVWAVANDASAMTRDSITQDIEELGSQWLGLFQDPQQFIDNLRATDQE